MTFSWKVGHVLLHHLAMPDNMSHREKVEEDAIGACPGRREPGRAWCPKRLWMLCISSTWASDVPSQVMTSRWGHEVDFGTCVKRSTKMRGRLCSVPPETRQLLGHAQVQCDEPRAASSCREGVNPSFCMGHKGKILCAGKCGDGWSSAWVQFSDVPRSR